MKLKSNKLKKWEENKLIKIDEDINNRGLLTAWK